MTLFEVSWEVCNKVGGIYTVVRSKAPFLQEKYQEYVLIGPLIGRQNEFDPQATPEIWEPIFSTLEKQGIICRYGRWLIPGNPEVILINAPGLIEHKNDLKGKLWERYGIDSWNAKWEFEEPMCFATAAGMLIEEYAKQTGKQTLCHAHEWIAGFSLLHLKAAGARVATVFTTHATMLGRTISDSNQPLYDLLGKIDPKEWAYRYNIQEKHLTEVACAKACDLFTTVSDITGLEAEALLGRKPEVILYNGFSVDRLPTFEETNLKHYHSREQLHELIAYTFFPHYAFDLENTLLFFTSGRHEFHNKGIDVLITSLGRLNRQLKEEKSNRTIVMFFWVIMGRGNVRSDLLEQKNTYFELRSSVNWQAKQLLHKVSLDFLSGRTPGKDDLFTSDFLQGLKEELKHIRREGNPPLNTHDVYDEQQNPILTACRHEGLLNREEDKVKVLVYPGYLDGSDGLLNLQYYDATVGAHLGIFPSCYEPWGYTPLESAMLGIPAVTTDTAGFGRYVSAATHGKGIFVIPRFKRSEEEATASLTQTLHSFTLLDRDERVQQGFLAKTLANSCDWKKFIQNYLTAHNMALERAGLPGWQK
jgi:glycogen synthase